MVFWSSDSNLKNITLIKITKSKIWPWMPHLLGFSIIFQLPWFQILLPVPPWHTHTLFVLSSPISFSEHTPLHLIALVLPKLPLRPCYSLMNSCRPDKPIGTSALLHPMCFISQYGSQCSHFCRFPCFWVLTLAGPHIREEGGRTLKVPSVCQASWHHFIYYPGVLGKLLEHFSFLSTSAKWGW